MSSYFYNQELEGINHVIQHDEKIINLSLKQGDRTIVIQPTQTSIDKYREKLGRDLQKGDKVIFKSNISKEIVLREYDGCRCGDLQCEHYDRTPKRFISTNEDIIGEWDVIL